MSEPSLVKIAGVQMDPKLAENHANLAAMLAKFDEAVGAGAKLVVFPECALSGYGFASKAEGFAYSETIPGPATETFAKVCAKHSAFVIFGLLERTGEKLFNACTLVGPSGVVGTYRKIHLPYLGVDRFADPGDRPLEVLVADGLRIGMHICYDGTFPETGRVLSLLGADLLVLPTNWPRHSESAADHMVPCRALENVVYMIAVDRVGEEKGFRFVGRSSIASPAGEVLAKASPDGEEIIYADVDPAKARTKRLIRVPGKHELDRIKDRRPGFYSTITEPNPFEPKA